MPPREVLPKMASAAQDGRCVCCSRAVQLSVWRSAQGALRCTWRLRAATLAVVHAIRSWRVSVGDRPFLHRGENYLLTIRDDLDALNDLNPPKNFGFFLGNRNPFVLPLQNPHQTAAVTGGRRLLSQADETLARNFATVSREGKEELLVAHEYLVREERARMKKMARGGGRIRRWGYEKWVTRPSARGW